VAAARQRLAAEHQSLREERVALDDAREQLDRARSRLEQLEGAALDRVVAQAQTTGKEHVAAGLARKARMGKLSSDGDSRSNESGASSHPGPVEDESRLSNVSEPPSPGWTMGPHGLGLGQTAAVDP